MFFGRGGDRGLLTARILKVYGKLGPSNSRDLFAGLCPPGLCLNAGRQESRPFKHSHSVLEVPSVNR